VRPRCPWTLGALYSLCFSLGVLVTTSGCCTVPRVFLEGEEAAYSALTPLLVKYVRNDVGLTEDLREDIIRTTIAWKFSLERAREALNGEGEE
jgi:hypothetical protein